MRIKDLHLLPKLRDGWSYLYVEHCRIDKEASAVAVHDENGKVSVPCANLALLMLGPGVSITHSAIVVLSDHGCLIGWCGEQGIRFYAVGMGETRSASNFLHQARMWSDENSRMKVVRRLYQLRFRELFDPRLSLKQIRGMEGARVRDTYARCSSESGVPWSGRTYKRESWSDADPINRALSTANACLYGICHAAIVSAGFSPALGFVHTGKMLSFVYDVADLYKTEITIPVAFRSVAEDNGNLERLVRHACRDYFVSTRLLTRIIPDIQTALMLPGRETGAEPDTFNSDAAAPGGLWDPEDGEVSGGQQYGLSPEHSEETDGRDDP